MTADSFPIISCSFSHVYTLTYNGNGFICIPNGTLATIRDSLWPTGWLAGWPASDQFTNYGENTHVAGQFWV